MVSLVLGVTVEAETVEWVGRPWMPLGSWGSIEELYGFGGVG